MRLQSMATRSRSDFPNCVLDLFAAGIKGGYSRLFWLRTPRFFLNALLKSVDLETSAMPHCFRRFAPVNPLQRRPMFLRFAVLISGVVLLAITGCSQTNPSRSVVSKSHPGSGFSNRGKIQPIDFPSGGAKESVVLEADHEETKPSRWELLNPFGKKKKRIPLPLSTPETDEQNDRSHGGF